MEFSLAVAQREQGDGACRGLTLYSSQAARGSAWFRPQAFESWVWRLGSVSIAALRCGAPRPSKARCLVPPAAGSAPTWATRFRFHPRPRPRTGRRCATNSHASGCERTWPPTSRLSATGTRWNRRSRGWRPCRPTRGARKRSGCFVADFPGQVPNHSFKPNPHQGGA